MIGIEALASYIPPQGLDTTEAAKQFGKDLTFLENRIGTSYLPQLLSPTATVEMAIAACENLFEKTGLDAAEVELLVLVTQNPDSGGLPHNSALVHKALGLGPLAQTFDIGLGCSGWVQAISIVTALMAAKRMRNAILVTSDPYSKILGNWNSTTSLLFGDGATATLLSASPRWVEVGSRVRMDSPNSDKLGVSGGQLEMNGRAIYEFAARTVPQEIRSLLLDLSVDERNVGSFIMHQGSKAIVDAISRSFPDATQRFPRKLHGVGNTVSSSVPMTLQHAIENQNETSLNFFVACGFGVGLACATSAFKQVT